MIIKTSLRKLPLLIVLPFLLPDLSHAVEKWYNPEDSHFRVIQGQAYYSQERDGFYHRLPAKAKDTVRKSVWKRSLCPSGQSLVFSTDAEKITIRYQVSRAHSMPNMPATGVSGVDLYTYDRNGKEIYLAGKYQFKDTITFTIGGDSLKWRCIDKINPIIQCLPFILVELIGTHFVGGFRFYNILVAPLEVIGSIAYLERCCHRVERQRRICFYDIAFPGEYPYFALYIPLASIQIQLY